MGRYAGSVALVVALALAGPAGAQPSLTNFVGSFNAQPIVNVPIDTSAAIAPLPTFTKPFSLSDLLAFFKLPSFPLTTGTSPLPPPSSFPGAHYPSVIKPVMPIFPNQ